MRIRLLLGAALAAATWAVHGAGTLYADLGQREGLDRLMSDFVVRLKADARIGRRFKDTNLQHLASQLRDQLCQLADGPCKYEGPSMKQAHEGMAIGKADFNALVEVLQDTMSAQQVPFPVQNRLLARLAPMYRDMIETPQD